MPQEFYAGHLKYVLIGHSITSRFPRIGFNLVPTWCRAKGQSLRLAQRPNLADRTGYYYGDNNLTPLSRWGSIQPFIIASPTSREVRSLILRGES